MPRGKGQETLQQLPWASDNHAAIWKLVSALEDPDNRRKLFGKGTSEVKGAYPTLNICMTDPTLCLVAQNTSGDSKSKIYGCIAECIWPELYRENPKVVTSRTKAKAEW